MQCQHRYFKLHQRQLACSKRLSVVMRSAAPAVSTEAAAFKASKPTLFDVPVSNNGARVRYVIYSKGLENEFDIVAPTTIGGLRSQQYLALNPQAKMPLLVLPSGQAIPESEVIVQYLLDKYSSTGPSLQPDTPELRAVAALATRIHDIYITSIQGCIYKKMDKAQRAAELAALVQQLDILEGTIVGPFVAGSNMSSADAALFPTFTFMTYILPKYFGWQDVFAGRPQLAAWWAAVNADPVAARVIAEVRGGLEGWSKNERWQQLGINEQLQDSSFKWVY